MTEAISTPDVVGAVRVEWPAEGARVTVETESGDREVGLFISLTERVGERRVFVLRSLGPGHYVPIDCGHRNVSHLRFLGPGIVEGDGPREFATIANLTRQLGESKDRAAAAEKRTQEAQTRAREADARTEAAESRHATWIESIVEDAHEWADENDLCEKFDEFMEDHGLPTRTRTYTVWATVSARVPVNVEARSYDDARDDVGEHEIRKVVEDDLHKVHISDYHLDEFED